MDVYEWTKITLLKKFQAPNDYNRESRFFLISQTGIMNLNNNTLPTYLPTNQSNEKRTSTRGVKVQKRHSLNLHHHLIVSNEDADSEVRPAKYSIFHGFRIRPN